MKHSNPIVDEYIFKAAPFAKPMLEHIRACVHKACPDVTETIKWGHPHFEYHGVICGFASFKAHCALFFKRPDLIDGLKENISDGSEHGMGQFGHLKDISELPKTSTLIKWIREAAKLNKNGTAASTKIKQVKKKLLKCPAYIKEALNKNKKIALKFNNFTDAQRNEYIEWITDAKTEPTRLKRIDSMLDWVEEGKTRNWKYMDRYK